MRQYTAAGQPLATERRTASAGPDEAVVEGVRMPVAGRLFANRAHAYSKKHNVNLREAQKVVLRDDPEALADYQASL